MRDSSSTTGSIARDLRRSWPGLLVSAVLLVIVFAVVDLEALVDSLALADYRYFFPALLIFLVGLGVRTFAWRTLLQEAAGPKKTFFALNEGYLLNNLLPFRLGEFGRAFLLSRSAGIGFLRVLSSIAVERIFDLSLVVGVLLITLPFVVGAQEWARPAALSMGTALLLVFIFLHLLARNQDRARGWFQRLQQRLPPLRRIGVDQLDTLFQGLAALVDLRRFLLVLFSLGLTWLLVIYHYYLVLLAFVPHGEFLWAAFGIGVVGLGVAVPSAPGSVGVVQGVIVAVFPPLFGLSPAVALAYALTVHAFYLVVTSVLGLIGLALERESLTSVYGEIRTRIRPSQKVERPGTEEKPQHKDP